MASRDTFPSAPKTTPPGLINSAGSTFETPKRRDGDPPGLINSFPPKPGVESDGQWDSR
jgi:hypothetical protein